MEKIVEKIHHDINTAYLDRFRTCSEVIDREKVESQKYDIAKLGFKSYESEIEKSEKIKESKEYIETINRLKIEYPYKKFITYDQLGKIIEKYPLVLDTPERFIGKIPSNCMKDILDFKLQPHDEGFDPTPEIIYSKKNKDANDLNTINEIVMKILSIIRERSDFFMGRNKPSSEERMGVLLQQYGNLVNVIYTAMGVSSFLFCNSHFRINQYFFILDNNGGSRYSVKTIYSLKNSDYNITVIPRITYKKPSFWILATEDQFDIKPTEIVVAGCITEVGSNSSLSLLKDDPIIFKPIKEGLIVVKQWGAEAELPEFINPNNN